MPAPSAVPLVLERIEALRIPVEQPGAPADWKEWYHFLLFDLDTGIRVLVNASLCGTTEAGEVQSTIVVTLPLGEDRAVTHGSALSSEWHRGMVRRNPLSILSEQLQLSLNGRAFDLAVSDSRARLALVLRAEAAATPLLVTDGTDFGSGFIGWGLIPRLDVSGELTVCERSWSIDKRWLCYQDHNFGRFHWGENIGWEWLVAYARTEDHGTVCVVFDLRTDRDHRVPGLPYLFVYLDRELQKVFVGPAIRARWAWSEATTLPPRLPGAMASVLSDSTAREPVALEIEAADERDRLSLRLKLDAFMELVVPDNVLPRTTRIGESTGPVRLEFVRPGRTYAGEGYAYAEYTH